MAELQSPKCTVISIAPFEIRAYKPGIYPGNFYIPQSENNVPSCLIVGESIYYLYVGDSHGDTGTHRENIRMRQKSDEIAKSIVDDELSAQLLKDRGSPGLFWVYGEYNTAKAQKELITEITQAKVSQLRWFKELVTLADDDYIKSGKMSRSVSDIQRIAARTLGLEREWIMEISSLPPVKTSKCPICRKLIESDAIMCGYCKLVLKPEEYKKYQFAGV